MSDNKQPPIYFYLPSYNQFERDLPRSPETSWEWMFERGKPEYNLSDGEYAWSLQTFLQLQARSFPCQITATMPEKGIVITHRINLPLNFKPGPELLLICLQADKAPHPFAQLSVVLTHQALHTQYSFLGDIHAPKLRSKSSQPLEGYYFMRHWPIPGLIPRNPARGDRFENVVFLGVGRSLAPELKTDFWKQSIKELGLNWSFRGPGKRGEGWKDFGDIDVVFAVRRFECFDNFAWKPATKLFNAWHAGVPAILGWESAYQAERKSDLDYLEVKTVEEALAALKRLRDDVPFRTSIVENGRQRAHETQPEILAQQWIEFLTEVAVPAYDRWCSNSVLHQKRFFLRRQTALLEDGLQRFFGFKIEGLQKRLNALGKFFDVQ